MRVVHPKTGSVLLMVDGSDLIAEVERDTDIQGQCLDTVLIGHLGSSASSLTIYRDEFEGFMALVQQIDLEFRHEMGAVGELKP